jgi:arsenate reductase (thioredoxin)
MCEAWVRHLKPDIFDPFSAGITKTRVDPYAIKVMAEAGIDMTNHYSKTLDALKDHDFEYVITVCDNARESCPLFLGESKVMHFGFDDPPQLAKEVQTEEEILAIYRRVRDEIRRFVDELPNLLTKASD